VFGKLLGALGKLLIVSGLLVLGFVAYQLWGTSLETNRGQSELTDELASELGASGEDVDSETVELDDLTSVLAERNPATAPPTAPPPEGDPVGIITIPRIGLEAVVVEGVNKADLKKGPGHYPGTPLPGQAGNSGIAGHRTTYGAPFNRIDELVPGDDIKVATPQGEFTYRVIPAPGQPADGQAWYTVTPSQVEVLADMGDDRITLTACHPKYSARERIIVHAVLEGPVAAAAAVPAGAATPDDAGDDAAAAAAFDEGLEGDPDALRSVLLFGGAAAAVALLAWFLARHLRPWLVWALATPAILVLVWFGYVYMDRYLPAI
jgi:sortase A